MAFRRVTVLLSAVVASVCLSGCGTVGDIFDGHDSFKDRQEAIDAVYEQGQSARRSMEKTGVVVDETSCDAAFTTSGAKNAEDDIHRDDDVNFQELRRLSFVNGCMDRPNSLPATNAPGLVTPTATR